MVSAYDIGHVGLCTVDGAASGQPAGSRAGKKKQRSVQRLGRVTIPFFKVCEHHRAFLSRPRLAHDLAAFESLLLACWHATMTVRLKVINRKWARMMHMGIKCQHECGTLLHEPNTCMATTMNTTLVAFRIFTPPPQINMVGWQIGLLSPHKQPRLKTAHPLGKLLVHGVNPCLPLLPQQDELGLTLLPCGFVTRLQEAIDCAQVLHIAPHLRQGLRCSFHAAVNTISQTLQQRLGTPPFLASRLRSSDSRPSCNASLIRTPGG